MKLTVLRTELLRMLGHVRPIVESAWMTTDTRSVQLIAKSTTLEIAATDAATSLILKCPAIVAAQGRSFLDHGQLVRILANLPTHLVELSTDDGGGTRIESGNLVARAPRADAIASVRDDAARPGLRIPSSALMTALGRTIPCMPCTRWRYSLPSMFVEMRERPGRAELRFIATDGHRLATAAIVVRDATVTPGWPASAAMPSEAARLLPRLLTEHGEVILGLDSETGFVRSEAWTLGFRLTVDRMPSWRHFMDLLAQDATTVDRHELMDALRRLVHLGGDRLSWITLDRVGDDLVFVAPGGDISARDAVHIVDAASGSLSFRLDPRYVLAMLEVLTGDSVTLSRAQLADSTRGVLRFCRVTAEGDAGYVGVVMPVADDAGKGSDLGAGAIATGLAAENSPEQHGMRGGDT